MSGSENSENEMDQKQFEQKTTDPYEVGYRRPPKNGQFRKGVSGNPNGRPKTARDVRAAVLRELNTLVTITENGRQIRVSKAEVIAKQTVNSAIKTKPFCLRFVFETSQEAAEKDAILAAQKAKDAANEKNKNYKAMSTEELERMLARQIEAARWIEENEKPDC